MNLHLLSPINSLGVGRHSFQLGRALHHQGHHIMLTPVFNSIDREGLEAEDELMIQGWVRNREQATSFKIASLYNFHPSYLTQFYGQPRVGMVVFETDKLSNEEVRAIETCDIVLTPSHWSQGVLANHGITAQVVNEGVDLDKYLLSPRKMDGTIIFGSVGKYEKRKSTPEILQAYLRGTEDAKIPSELRLHCWNPFMKYDDLLKQLTSIIFAEASASFLQVPGGWQFTHGKRKIMVYTHRFQQESDMVEFYHGLDYFLHFSKAEGWSLPLIEALACGVPAITTDITGHSEFLKTYPDALKLKKVAKKVAHDGVWFHGQKGDWYEPHLGELTDMIKGVMKNPTQYETQREMIRNCVAPYTWDAAAESLIKVLS